MEDALERVGLRPEETLGRYPHQLSGGQRQRIAVARALLLKPKLLITDEPVSMVDASLRSTILKSLRAHEPGVWYSDLVHHSRPDDGVPYQRLYHHSISRFGDGGRQCRFRSFGIRNHPYTKLLVSSIPWPDPELPWGGTEEMIQKSQVAFKAITGCKFAPRCPYRMDICDTKAPELYRPQNNRVVACYLIPRQRGFAP